MTGATPRGGHTPVLLAEVLEALQPRDGGIYVDGTFGAGGYATGLLEAADCRVVGFDRDPNAIRRGAALARRNDGRLDLIEGRFGEMDHLLSDVTQRMNGYIRRVDTAEYPATGEFTQFCVKHC